MREKDLDRNNSLKGQPFKVPDGYFAEKKNALYSIASEDAGTKVIPLWKQTYVWSSGIAALLALALFVYFQQTKPNTSDVDLTSNSEVSLNTLSTDEIEEYLLDGYLYSTDDALIHSELDMQDFLDEELNL